MTLSKTQHDLLYDTISQSSPGRMVEEKIKKAGCMVTIEVTELLQAFSFLRQVYIQEYLLVGNLTLYK